MADISEEFYKAAKLAVDTQQISIKDMVDVLGFDKDLAHRILDQFVDKHIVERLADGSYKVLAASVHDVSDLLIDPATITWDIEAFKKIYNDDPIPKANHVSVDDLLRDRKPSDQHFSEEDLAIIEANFHNLIRYRCRRAPESLVWLDQQELPKITNDLLQNKEIQWFPVAGMYGGFAYALFDYGEPVIMTDSWSRIIGGSGEQHRVSVGEVRLVAEGFV